MKIFYFALLILIGSDLYASDSIMLYKNIELYSKKIESVFKEHNLSGLVDLMYPKVVSLMGGKQKTIGIIKQVESEILADGFTMNIDSVGHIIQLVKAGNELHGIIPEYIYLKNEEGFLQQTAYLMIISIDDGETWSFIDTQGLIDDPSKIKMVFPNYNYDLRIPKKTKAIFYPK